jgi:hypothetical protein
MVFVVKGKNLPIITKLPNRVHVGHLRAFIAGFPFLAALSTAIRPRIANIAICNDKRLELKVLIITDGCSKITGDPFVAFQKKQAY